MDYSLAAMKLLCSQLAGARPTETSSASAAFSLDGILFQRAWIQGVLVPGPQLLDEEGRKVLLLDDGTGIMELQLSGEFQNQEWRLGMYVMAVGLYSRGDGGVSRIKVHKVVDLSACPDRETLWHLEVIEAYGLFYGPMRD